MNPILRSYFKQIDVVLADLGETLADQAARIQKERKAREKLLTKHWADVRKNTTLKENHARFERILAENERFEGREALLRERLQSLLKKTKALAEGLRS